MRVLLFILFTLSQFLVRPAFADGTTSIFKSQPLLSGSLWGKFTAPNEEYPQRLIPYLQKAPSGVIVAVGTERGFIDAANTPNATGLLLTDIDKSIVAYNQVNMLLLKISKDRDRENYDELRLHPSESEWLQAAERAHLDPATTRHLLSQLNNWKADVVDNRDFASFQRPPTRRWSKFGPANYLYNDNPFAKIQKLAKSNTVAPMELNLSNAEAVENLVSQMKQEHLTLSVLDLSNAWWNFHIDRKVLKRDLELFNSVASPETLLIITNYRWPAHGHAALDRTNSPFQYSVYTFNHIRKFKTVSDFVATLRWSLFRAHRQPTFDDLGPQSLWSRLTCKRILSASKNF